MRGIMEEELFEPSALPEENFCLLHLERKSKHIRFLFFNSNSWKTPNIECLQFHLNFKCTDYERGKGCNGRHEYTELSSPNSLLLIFVSFPFLVLLPSFSLHQSMSLLTAGDNLDNPVRGSHSYHRTRKGILPTLSGSIPFG